MDRLMNLCTVVQIVLSMVSGQTSKVIVNSKIGPIQGFTVLSGNMEVAVFRGIPYAEPPTGNRRFVPPVPVRPWKNALITSDYGSMCVQTSYGSNQSFVGDEDCLTLNVFKPMLFTKESKNIPVIVMVHTGNFVSGSSRDVNGVELSKHLESIIVSLNYRLGIFGFYSMSGHIKENLGVLDQITALKWIQNNIKDFNGDPENILLVADHITASIHLLSPLSRILFNRAISYDGETYANPVSGYNFDLENHRPWLESFCGPIAPSPGIPVEHIVWVCLRKQNAENLVELTSNLFEHTLWHPFRPVFDGKVISSDSHIHSSFLNCDYMAFKSDLNIPLLSTPDENTTSCEDMFEFAINDITKAHFTQNRALIKSVFKTNYFPTFASNSYDFCKALKQFMNDMVAWNIIEFANHHSRTGLTFVNFAKFDNSSVGSPPYLQRLQSTDIACILTNKNAASCNFPNHMTAGIRNIVRTFLYHGYPTVNPDTIWRPYTTTSKNYLQTTASDFRTGDSGNWPLRKTEKLWQDVLENINELKTSNSEPEVKLVKQSVGLSWGLTEQQLEALVFSLILSCLVLLCVTLTLFRIVCFVSGKKLSSKNKKKQSKEIVLTKSNKRTDSNTSLSREIFNIQESVNLHRRSADLEA